MIKIAHLYYDLMNLYGENGNIKALKKAFENQKLEVEISFITINDHFNPKDYDIIYIGSGTEENLILALNDINKYDKNLFLKTYIIATGNGNALFGKNYKTINNEIYSALNLYDYESIETPFRTVGENIYHTDLIDQPIIGFLNHQLTFNNYSSNLFKVIDGNGYKPKSKEEGLLNKYFLGTLLLGPFFIRNPYFTNYYIKTFMNNKKLEYQEINESTDIDAYNNFLKNFINN